MPWTLRLNRCALLLLFLAYVPGIVAAVAALVYAGVLLIVSGLACIWMAAVGVALIAVAITLLLGLAPLAFRRVRPGRPGMPLLRNEHPRFYSLLDDQCRRIGTRPPHACFLTPGTDACIGDFNFADPGHVVHRGIRTLVIGAGLIVQMRTDEFATVLCHEMAHSAAGDTHVSSLIDRFYRSMAAQMENLDSHSSNQGNLTRYFVSLLLLLYFRFFWLLYAIDERWREHGADRVAAEVCGPQNTRDMLVKGHLLDRIPHLSIDRLFFECITSPTQTQNVYDEYRRRWAELPAARREAAENEMFLEPGTIWDSHPPLARRLRSVTQVQAPEWTNRKPATDLFTDWTAIEKRMTQMILTLGRHAHARDIALLDAGIRHSLRQTAIDDRSGRQILSQSASRIVTDSV